MKRERDRRVVLYPIVTVKLNYLNGCAHVFIEVWKVSPAKRGDIDCVVVEPR